MKTKVSGAGSGKSKTKTFSGYTYQHYQPMTIEATFQSDKTTPSDARSKSYRLQAGSQMPGIPLSMGLSYENSKDTSDDGSGGTETDKSTELTLSTTYKMDGSLYLGAGYIQMEYNPDNSYSDDDDLFYFGAGFVSESLSGESVLLLSNEEGIKSYYLFNQGALNMGPNQLVGKLDFISSNDKGTEYESTYINAKGGYFIDMQAFYLQPSLGYNISNGSDDFGDKTKYSGLSTEIEAGVRTSLYNVYVGIGLENTEVDNENSSKIKREETSLTVGGHVYF